MALLINDDGGRLIATPGHSDAYNRCISTWHIKHNEDNTSLISATVDRRGDLQDTLRQVVSQNDQKVTQQMIYAEMHLKNTTILSYSVREMNPDSPQVVLNIQMTNENTVRKTDTRVFIKTDLFSPVPTIPIKSENRTQPIYINTGYSQTDTLVYELPADYLAENFTVGDMKKISSSFGAASCSIQYITAAGELIVIRSFLLKSGIYGKEEYPAFREFLLQTARTICPELVLRKKG
jgi:hypothetical protein